MFQDANVVRRDHDLRVADTPRTLARDRDDARQQGLTSYLNQWFTRQAL
jgi:hypothetical protein